VSSVEDKVGGIKVEAIEGQFGELDDLGGDSREDRVALGKEGVKGSAQAVVVQALGGDVPEEIGPSVLGPGGEFDEGGGLEERGGEQEAQDGAVGEGELGIGGQMAVDDRGEVEPLEEWCNEGQGAEGQSLVGESRPVPGVRHRASAGNRGQGR